MITTEIYSSENCSFVDDPNSSCIPKKQKKICQTIFFKNPPTIIGFMAIVGEKEGNGPIGKYFKHVQRYADEKQTCFEKEEIKYLENAINGAVLSSNLNLSDINVLISGDLLNQMTTSSFVARSMDVVHLGVYSACATMAESLALGANLVSSGAFNKVACATSSNFATAERQFRYPLEYGSQRPPYSQWTVTGAGCTILSSDGIGAKITSATLGKVIDFGQKDLSNMGSAMAPAAMDTAIAVFEETNTCPKDFDLILTGDLGKLGSDIFRELMSEKGYELGQNYIDCGCLIYDHTQSIYQGGSGCGCSASVLNSFILDKMEQRVYNKVLFLATGALMSTQSCYQGGTIPCISHAIIIENLE